MTRVIFYLNIDDREKFLYKFLYQKIFKANDKALIYAEDEAFIERLDENMWKEKVFLPHHYLPEASAENQDMAPILLTVNPPSHTFQGGVLVSFSPTLPPFFSQFSVYVDIVDKKEESKRNARIRYQQVKDEGYDIALHRL